MHTLNVPKLRPMIDQLHHINQLDAVAACVQLAALSDSDRTRISAKAAQMVRDIRSSAAPGLMEVFLAEYGLSTDEGIALMCLAEALLRVPDAPTIDALIEDKIAPSDWGRHLGKSASSLVNASTWALMLTGRVLDDERPGVTGHLRGAIKRLGEPVIRTATARAMREMGRQFVLGEDIVAAMKRADGMQAKGFTYSYDMLGEAARTAADAAGYQTAYRDAITAIAAHCKHATVAQNPGISVKLSALHPRYEVAQYARVMAELPPRLLTLAQQAAKAGMGLNIDAEEANRLSLSLDVIEQVLAHPSLAGWDGFGVVVQAYGQRAPAVIDTLADMAQTLDRKIMVRLVKGAYWDAEIKTAQVAGLQGFPVYASKPATDVSYIACARKLLTRTDRIYPQFATHNAHTVAAVLDIAASQGCGPDTFEFQRLHGMGETLHTQVLQSQKTHCRIYAPVGAHEDLLAYLVRRLLENGANSSFVNQIVDEDVPAEVVAACPFDALDTDHALPDGPALFPGRTNSAGWDLDDAPTLHRVADLRAPYAGSQFHAAPLIAGTRTATAHTPIINPADPSDQVGTVQNATATDVSAAFTDAKPWDAAPTVRAEVLRKAADLYEDNAGLFFALLTREAGKTLNDGVSELREAVDFLRYYADEIAHQTGKARGTWACISPWNFPLAIYSGQIAAALGAGNAVVAKPAGQTPLTAHIAAQLMHQAGVPLSALQLLPGGPDVGAAITANPTLAGVAFTGSTPTARLINQSLADHAAPGTPLIAETGGINAMIVDSTALPEHAVRDIIASAFQSAGQRCSALRCLYVQEDIADSLTDMLKGAMDELTTQAPWDLPSDLGPVIDADAHAGITTYLHDAQIIHQLEAPKTGHFIAPTLVQVAGIGAIPREIFGPVLHIATFKSKDLDHVITDINATGYGLTFGLHTRIDDRVQHITETVQAGNIYVNRDQIGAVVGSQPFGGEGLSGTGPKAGGPHYMPRYRAQTTPMSPQQTNDLPGPTGESNRHHVTPRGDILCLGPDVAGQETAVRAARGTPVRASVDDPVKALSAANPAAVMWWGDAQTGRTLAKALAAQDGPLVPLITGTPDVAHVCHERHICIDTTAAGGNAALLAQTGG